jgi:uncharacterized protein (DUF2267 family)
MAEPRPGAVGQADGVDHERFIGFVQQASGLGRGEAERAMRAVLETLAERLSAGEARDLALQLPPEVAPFLGTDSSAEPFDADEFLRRVGERAGLDLEAAGRATAAVLQTLGERISGGEVRDLIDVLPAELHEPLRRGDELSNGAARRMSLTGFVRRVAEREGVIPAEAQEHARAVLATLREALPRKEWLDVTAQLPEEYAAIAARP